MEVVERLEQLRINMKSSGVDYVIIPTADYHNSEYVHKHFSARSYFSGFTGSAGTLIVGLNQAYLWVDGRYFIQAENQLKNSTIELMKMREPNVPTIEEFLAANLKEKQTLAVDGRVITVAQGVEYQDICKQVKANFVLTDLVTPTWLDRPALPNGQTYLVKEENCGVSASEKIADLRQGFKDYYLDSTLDNIAWLLNVRGKDVPCNPVFLSYILVSQDSFNLYVEKSKLNPEVSAYLEKLSVTIKEYNAVYDDLKKLKDVEIQLNKKKCNYALCASLDSSNTVVDKRSSIEMAKACKNPTEVKSLRSSHLKDGIACTKFMYWLKHNVGQIVMSEISADEKLTSLRAEQPGFIERSFGTIAGYREHAAMMHYGATKESDYQLEASDMLLVDSGGQYEDGTTDITRTFALGPVSEEMRRDFTLTLKCNISLAKQKFLYGCGGVNLDILARSALWQEGIDFKCGTGHGIGFILNVHEGPHGIRWQRTMDESERIPFEEGMVVTDEPGVYKEGQYGIRIENELVVQKDVLNEYGQFMSFECITYVPIDLDLIIPELLNNEERKWLNDYHQSVREMLTPYMNQEEKAFLDQYTRAI